MSNAEKMQKRISETLSKLSEGYIRKVMVYADTLYEIQLERSNEQAAGSSDRH